MTFDLYLSLKLVSSMDMVIFRLLFRALNKLDNILWRLPTTILNGVISKNDFDLLTSGDLDLGLRSPKILLFDPRIMTNHCVKFYRFLR